MLLDFGSADASAMNITAASAIFGGTSYTATVTVVPYSGRNAYQIKIAPSTSQNILSNATFTLKYTATANCSLLQSGAAHIFSGSSPSIPAQYAVSTSSATPASFALPNTSGIIANTVALDFQYLTVTAAYPSTLPACLPAAAFGVSSVHNNGTGGSWPLQDYSAYTTMPAALYRKIKLNNLSDLNYTFAGSVAGTIQITDQMNLPGLWVSDIVVCNGGTMSSVVYGGSGVSINPSTANNTTDNYTINISLVGLNTIQTKSGIATTTTFPAGTSVEFYEKLIPAIGGAYTVCGRQITSSLYCNWSCSSASLEPASPYNFCLSTLYVCEMDFPILNPKLVTTTQNIPADPNTCYNDPNGPLLFSGLTPTRHQYFSLVNQGGATADSIVMTFSGQSQYPYTGNGWTDYDLSAIFNGIYNTTANGNNAPGTVHFTITNGTAPARNILPIDIQAISPTIASLAGATSASVPNMRSITITFRESGSTPIKLAPGDHIDMDWYSYTFVPNTSLCANNSMDQWEVSGSFGGTCDGARALINAGSYKDIQPHETVESLPISIPTGPSGLTGHQGQTSYGTPAVYNCNIPPITMPNGFSLWPSATGSISYVVRIELGTDIKVFDTYNNNYISGSTGTNNEYATGVSTDLLNNILFASGAPAGSTGSTLITPTCIHYVGATSASPYHTTDLPSGRNVIEAVFNTTTPFNQAVYMTLNLEPHCDLNQAGDGGNDPINITLYEVPNNTCAGAICGGSGTPAEIVNKIPVACTSTVVQVVCPGCKIAGIYSNGLNYPVRETYGTRDVNNDAVEDIDPTTMTTTPVTIDVNAGFAAGSSSAAVPLFTCNTAGVDQTLMMYSDVFRIRTFGNIQADNNVYPDLSTIMASYTPHGFPYVYTRISFGASNGFPATPHASGSYFTPFNDNGANQYIALRWWMSGTGPIIWSNPVYAYAAMVQNPITKEFCYRIDASSITDPSFPGFVNGLNISIDFNFQVTDNVRSGEPYHIMVTSKVYGGFRTEDFNDPTSWLVEMQSDPSFGDPTFLSTLISPPSPPIDEYIRESNNYLYSGSAYSGGHANTLIYNYRDIRWFCVPASSTIRLAGYDWVPATINKTDSTNTASCNWYAFTNPQSLKVGSITNFPNYNSNAFPNEYRGWAYPYKYEIYSSDNTMVPTYTASPSSPYVTTGSTAPFVANSITSGSQPGGQNTSSNIFYTGSLISKYYTGGCSNSIFPFYVQNTLPYNYFEFDNAASKNPCVVGQHPDDGFTNTAGFNFNLTCGQNPFTFLLRSSCVFPPNHLSEINPPVSTSVGSLTGIGADIRIVDTMIGTSALFPAPNRPALPIIYHDDTLRIHTIPPFTIRGNLTADGIASCGTVQWTEIVRAEFLDGKYRGGGSFQNPYVGFTNTPGWNITGVTLQYGSTGALQTLALDPVLKAWLDLTPYGAPGYETDLWGPTYMTNGTPYNTVIITAQYCPYDTPSAIPKCHVGNICDLYGMRTEKASAPFSAITGDAAVQWLDAHSCHVDSNDLPADFIDPTMVVVDHTDLSTPVPLCSSTNLKYTILDGSSQGTLTNIQVAVTVPTGSFYALGTPVAVDGNGANVTASWSVSGGVETITFPGATITGTGSINLTIPVTTNGCPHPLPTDPGITVLITSNDICNGISSFPSCSANQFVSNKGPYNPIVSGTAATVNQGLFLTLGETAPATDNGCSTTYHLSAQVSNPGPGFNSNNWLHFFVPSTSTISNVLFNGNSISYNPGGTAGEYICNLPSAGTLSLNVQNTGICGLTFDASIHSINCGGNCDFLLDSQYHAVSNLQPAISNTGACVQTVLTAGAGCPSLYHYSWSGTGTASGASFTPATAGTYTALITDGNGCTATASYTVTTLWTPLSVTIGPIVNATCNNGASDGALTADASGGDGSYTYTWSGTGTVSGNSYTGLAAGSYTVTVEDATCSTSVSATVSATDYITLTATVVTNACPGLNNGSLELSASGGIPEYSYVWSSGSAQAVGDHLADGLASGSYTVTVTDAHACSAVATAAIIAYPSLGLTVTPDMDICYTTSPQTLTASCTSCSYAWSGGSTTATDNVTPSATTVYTVTASVTESDGQQCSATASTTVTVHHPTISISPSGNIDVCGGTANIQLTANASAGTLVWSGGQSSSSIYITAPVGSAQTYTAMVTDAHGCAASAGTTVTGVNPSPTLSVSPSPLCIDGRGGTATITASGGNTYVWSGDMGSGSTISVSPTSNTTYSVTATDNHGCTGTASTTVTVSDVQYDQLEAQLDAATLHTGSCNSFDVPATITSLSSAASVQNSGNIYITIPAGYVISGVTDHSGATLTPASTSPTLNVYAIPSGTLLPCSLTVHLDASTFCSGLITAQMHVSASCTGSAPYTDFISGPIASVSVYPGVDLTVNGGCNAIQQTYSAVTLQTCQNGLMGYHYKWSPVISTGTLNATSGSPAEYIGSTMYPLSSGTYSVTVNDDFGCSASSSLSVTVPTPMIVGQSSTNAACGGQGAQTIPTISGGTPGYSFSWSDGAGSSFTSSTISGGVSQFLPNTVYSLTVTDANSCTVVSPGYGNWPAQVSAYDVHINKNQNHNCTTTLTASTDCGSGSFTYLWSDASTSSSLTTSVSGTYSVTVTDVSSGATVSASYALIVAAPPVVSLDVLNESCNGAGNGSLLITASDGNDDYNRSFSYHWSPVPSSSVFSNNMSNLAGLNISYPSTVTVTDVVSGFTPDMYNLTVQDDGTGCSASASATIADDQVTAGASVSTPSPVCFPASAVSVSGTYSCTSCTSASYQWSGSDGSMGSGASPTLTTSNSTYSSSVTYTVTVTDNNSCSSTASASINVDRTTVTLSASNTLVCSGNAVTLTADAHSALSSPTFTYLWSDPALSTSSGAVVTVNPTVTTVYTVTATDQSGCSGTASVTVYVTSAAAYLQPFSAINICKGSGASVDLIATSDLTGSLTYAWSDGAPSSATNVITPNTGGINTYTVTVSSSGCSAIASVDVNVIDINLSVTASASVICSGSGVNLSTSASGSGLHYLWSGGNLAPANTADVADVNDVPTASSNTYSVTVTDANGCSASASTDVNVDIVTASVSTSAAETCQGATVTLTASGTSSQSGSLSYAWTGGLPPTQTVTPTVLASTTYIVTVTDQTPCSATASVSVSAETGISGTITTTDATCYGGNNGSASISCTGGVGIYPYHWAAPVSSVSASATGLIAGTYSVTVNDDICTTVLAPVVGQSSQILLNDQEEGASSSTACNGTITLAPTGGAGGYTYGWTDVPSNTPIANSGASLSCIADASDVAFTVTDANGCIVSGSYTMGINTSNGNLPCTTCMGKTANPLSISSEQAAQNLLDLWPNPANSQVEISYFISADIKDASLVIYDVLGQPVKRISVKEKTNTLNIDLTSFAAATYSVVLINNGHQIGIRRLIKE